LVLLAFSLHCAQDTHDRIDAIYSAKAEPSAKNIEAIRGHLTDPDRDVRATAVNALVTLDVPDAAAIAAEALADEDGFVRSIAAMRLGDVGDASHVDRLVELLLKDPDKIVRQRAAESLGMLGGEEAVRGLIEGLSDPLDNVRLASVRGVREHNPELAIAQLSRLLLEDPIWEIRVQAARGLGATGDPVVAPVLETAMGDPNEFVRSAAAHALEVHRQVGEEGAGESSEPGALEGGAQP
jgi:HEAT repeat protein